MPSFDTVCEPNMVEVRNAVENAAKEIGMEMKVRERHRYGSLTLNEQWPMVNDQFNGQ